MQFFTTWIWAAGPIWLNLQALAMKGDYTWMPIAVMIGAGAGVGCYMVAMLRHPVWRMVALACAILAATYNVPTAIGSSSEHRRSATEPNRERIERRESLLRRDALLADKIAKIGWRLNGDTTFSIRAGIEQIKTTPHYISSDGCRNLKKRDPDGICLKLRGEEGRLSEAVQVEAFEAERETIRQALLKVAAPATADVQLATLMQLISPWYQITGDRLSAILSSIGPIVLELLGTFMPAIMGRFWSEKNESATGTQPEANRLPIPIAPEAPPDWGCRLADSGHSDIPIALSEIDYISEKFEPLPDGKLLARPAYSDYTKWGKRKGCAVVSEAEFIEAMEMAGYTKKLVEKRQHYVGVGLHKMKLEVVC